MTAPPPPRDRELLLGLAARVDPADAGAQNNLGVVYFGRGLIDEAVEAFHRALEIDPTDPVAARNLAVVWLTTGYHDRVTRALADRLRRDPADRAARLRLARAYRHTGRPEQAATELHRVLAADPDDASALRELGQAEKAAGRPDEALIVYERALEADPESAILHHHLGELHYHQGRVQAARRHLGRAVEFEPGFGEGWHALAFVLGDLGEDDGARRALARSRELRPQLYESVRPLSIDRASPALFRELTEGRQPRPEVAQSDFLSHYHLGIAFRQKGHHAEAVKEFRRGRDAGEDEGLLARAEAETLLLAGHDTEAIGIYRRLADEGPASPKVWNELAVCHHRAGRVGEAEKAYRRALEMDASYAFAANNLGVLLMERGDANGARAALDSAVQSRRLVESLANLGLIAAAAGRPDAALAHFREAIEVDPHSPSGWTGLGRAFAALGRLDEARQFLARAVERGPDRAEPRYRLAFVLDRLGEHEASVREARRAMSLDPHFAEARLQLAIELHHEYTELFAPELATEVRLDVGVPVADFSPEPAELEAAFERLQPQPPGTLQPVRKAYRLAEDYLAKGLRTRALAEIRRVARAGGDALEATLLTGELFLRSDLQGEAVEHFDAALTQLEGRAWGAAHLRGWLGLGRALLALGRWEEARHAAAVLIAREPAADPPRRLYAEALLGGGRAADALRVWRQLVLERPEDAGLAVELAAAAEAAGEPGEAISALERAIRIDPDRLAARARLGRFLLAEGREDDAAEQAHLALEIFPGYAAAALLLAEVEARRGNPASAVTLLVGLLEEDAYHLEALERLGDVLLTSGRVTDAQNAYRRLLRFDPDSAAARRGLAAAESRPERAPIAPTTSFGRPRLSGRDVASREQHAVATAVRGELSHGD